MHLIALVDDSDDSREVFYYLLRDNYDVISCANAEDAFERFQTQRPDVILMDISMPGVSGADALRRLRADDKLKHIPVIALTAHAMQGDREKYMNAGFDDYITKPVLEVNAVFAVLRQFLG